MNQQFICIVAAGLFASTGLGQTGRLPVPRPEVFNPSDPLNGGALPSKDAPSDPVSPGVLPGQTPPGQPGEKKEKGPTEITSGEATFDQKAHIAIFMTDVVVKDPEFNVVCDKLTAYLKHEEPGKPSVKTVKSTPRPAPPKPGEAPQKTGGGGLERAVAEMNPGGRVEITQDKKENDGSITHSIGHGARADYNASTGDIVLTGRPDVKKGTDWVIATEDSTVITLNRDGHMSTKGPTKTVIVSESVK